MNDFSSNRESDLLQNRESLASKTVYESASEDAFACAYKDQLPSGSGSSSIKPVLLAQICNPELFMPPLADKVTALLNNRIRRTA